MNEPSSQVTQQGTRVYRGKSLEEVLPRIKEELGPDAIVVRRRDGLVGGVGGFFQRPFVEVEAKPGGPRVDVYDEEDALPPLAELPGGTDDFEALVDDLDLDSPAQADHNFEPDLAGAFAAELQRADSAASEWAGERTEVEDPAPPPAPAPAQAAAPPQPAVSNVLAAGAARARGRVERRAEQAAAVERDMLAAGLSPELTRDLVAQALSHIAPFASGDLRKLVRAGLARRIPVAPHAAPGGRVVAFVGAGGSGKSLCAERLAAAYARGSDLGVVYVAFRTDPGELRQSLPALGVPVIEAGTTAEVRDAIAEHRDRALVVVDTPTAPRDPRAVAALANQVKRIGGVEVHVALPATLSRPAAEELLGRLAPFKPGRVALTHADETTYVGPAVDLALTSALPFSYVARAGAGPEVAPADPDELAGAVLP